MIIRYMLWGWGCLLVLFVWAYMTVGAHQADRGHGLQWRPIYVPGYYDTYKPSDYPVVQLGHAKEDEERAFRVCALAVGDGMLMVVYGEEGDPVEFHFTQPGDVCAYAYVGEGGGGEHLNHLDVYLGQLDGQEASIKRPEIKVGVTK